MVFGLDYSQAPNDVASFWWSPGWIAALKSAGVKFVVRYTSPSLENDINGKNLTPPEFSALRAAGFEICLVFETYAERMKGGYAAGQQDAAHHYSVVDALGVPEWPGYFACDWDATPEDQIYINAYLDGAASKIGRPRVGIYGGYWPCVRAAKAGKATYFWQTYAWSAANLPGDPNDLGGFTRNLFQYRNGMKLYGADVDYNKSLTADFGQWPRPFISPILLPPPTIPTDKRYEMIIASVTAPPGTGWQGTRTFTWDGQVLKHISSQQDQANLAKALPTVPITWGQYVEWGGR